MHRSQRVYGLCLLIFCMQMLVSAPTASAADAIEFRHETLMHLGAISALAIDGQGQLLASGGADGTVRLWALPTARHLRALRLPVPQPITALALSGDGALVVVGNSTQDGGALLLFDAPTGSLRWSLPLTSAPLSISFSPDSAQIAVGLRTGGLQVQDALDGKVRHHAPCPQDSAVAYEGRGRLLWACAGALVRLDAQHRAVATARVAASVRLRPSPSGAQVALSARDRPFLEVRGGDDLKVLATPDVRGVSAALEQLAWSADGKVLYAGGQHQQGAAYPVRSFSQQGAGPARDLLGSAAPITGLVTGAKELYYASAAPAWGRLLTDSASPLRGPSHRVFQPGEVAVDARGTRVRYARGTEQWTFSVGQQGLERAASSALGFTPIQGALALREGRLRVRALPDGTVRWFTGSEDRELLALFVLADRRVWVLWTPAGYYNASVDGERLLGLEAYTPGPVRAPDFFPVGLLRDHRLRPDVLRKILFTLDEEQAVEQANAEAQRAAAPPLERLLPPILKVLSPTDSDVFAQDSLTLQVAARSPSGEPIQVRARVLGSNTRDSSLSALKVPGGSQDPALISQPLPPLLVPPRDLTVEVTAQTAFTQSEPTLLRLRWREQAGAAHQQRLHVLTVGITEYKNPQLRLHYPAKDARDLAQELRRQQDAGLFPRVHVETLTDAQASRGALLLALRELVAQVRSEDLAVVLLAGHGMMDPRTGRYHYLPYDGDGEDMSRNLSAAELQQVLRGVRGRMLLLLDTCRAGGASAGAREARDADQSLLVNALGSDRTVVFAASTGGQVAKEEDRWKNGAFTKAILEGLRGEADYRYQGRIAMTVLGNYVAERVSALTAGEQTPTVSIPEAVTDFELARVQVRKPLYRQWWFWTLAGLAVAGAAAGAAIGVERNKVPVISFP